jgi:hypothetical protein
MKVVEDERIGKGQKGQWEEKYRGLKRERSISFN